MDDFTYRQIRKHPTIDTSRAPDFLTKFREAKDKHAEVLTDTQLAEYVRTNVAAGSDTTAIALRELVYRFLTTPESLRRFLDEIESVLAARPQDEEVDKPITWKEGLNMPYFQACLKECLRVHSPLGQMIPRMVPEGGVTLCGKYIPEGTVVGCNAWTVHRDKTFYGEDADEYRPERWLDEDLEKVRRMENASFAFGGGPRVCVGRNIALLEINKLIPELFRRFELHLVDKERYSLKPGWLVLQQGLVVKFKRRDAKT